MGKRKKISVDEEEEPNDYQPALKRIRSGILRIANNDVQSSQDVASEGNYESQRSSSAPSRVLAALDYANVDEDEEERSDADVVTPKKRRNGHQIYIAGRKSDTTPLKSLLNKNIFSTPVKANASTETDTPKIQRNADRSARRKSTRTLIERTILGDTSDNGEDDEDLAQHIYDSGEDDDLGQQSEDIIPQYMGDGAPETPSKRGRKKGSIARKRSPTPPQDLTPHEKYFYHNKGGRVKTSNNTLSSLALLDHEEYFCRIRNLKDPHEEAIIDLEQFSEDSFNQWQFELSQNFSLCLYGWGSKRSLLLKFADYTYNSQLSFGMPKIVVVNGYVSSLTIRDVLNTVATAVAEPGQKLGSQPTEMLESVFSLLEKSKTQHVTVIIHSIDQIPLRRPGTQNILSRLGSHPQIHLIASADHPSFSLLWDSSSRSTYNFVFHDCTTFQPYSVELDVVDEVHELLGRSGRRIGGKEGVSFVLKSLPKNAKDLFRILIGEQLAAMEIIAGVVTEAEDDEDADDPPAMKSGRSEFGVEYRVLYQKAVEEFICSNEMNFRTLLKEFHDHQMIQSRKDALGTETLSIPFRKEELETILEDIMS